MSERVPIRIIKSKEKPKRILFAFNWFASVLVGFVFAGVFCAGVYVFATYGVDAPYPAGNTLNPTCIPGTANCTVYPPLTNSFTADFSGSGNFATTATGIFSTLKVGSVYTFPTSAGSANKFLGYDGAGDFGWQTISAPDLSGLQPLATNLTSIGGLTNAAGWLHNNGSGTFAYSTPTYSDVGADVSGAAAAVTPITLGLVIGTNVQAYNSNLTAINQALTTTSSPSFTAVGATTFTGALSGNASTVTNGVYTTGSYSDPSWLTSLNATKISTGTGAVTIGAGGTNQNVTLTPSGSGYTILNGNVGIGSTTPGSRLVLKGSDSTSSNSALNVTNSGDTSMLFVRNDGNVGIGTTSPGAKLQVSSAEQYPLIIENSYKPATPRYYGALKFTGNSYDWGAIQTIQTNPSASWDNRMAFSTMNGAGGALVERMAIDNSGNVGIGTTAPGAKLHVSGGNILTDNNYGFQSKDNSGNITYTFSMDTGNYLNYGDTTRWAGMKFFPGGAEAMRITSIGNVGIGTTGPSEKLEVSGTAAGSTGINANVKNTDVTGITRLKVTNSSGAVAMMAIGGASYSGGGGSLYQNNALFSTDNSLYFLTNHNTATGGSGSINYTTGGYNNNSTMTITAGNPGNIGIGQTVPTSKLDITTTALGVTQTTSSGLALVNTTAAAAGAQQISPAIRWSGLGWKTNATAASQAVDFRSFVMPVQGTANPTGYLSFGSSVNGGAYNDGQMVITTAGNVGIGTTAPSSILTVAGSWSPNSLELQKWTIRDWDVYLKLVGYHDGKDVAFKFNLYQASNGSAGSTDVMAFSQGNVGIGNTAPLSKLGVTGSASVGATYGAIAAPTSGMIIEGNVGIGTTDPAAALTVTGQALFGTSTLISGIVTKVGMEVIAPDINNDIQILSNYTKTYGLTYQYTAPSGVPTFNIFGDYYSGSTAPNLVFGTYSYKTNQLVLANNGNILVGAATDNGGGAKVQVTGGLTTTGNVGIGTTTPGAHLQVADGNLAGRGISVMQNSSDAAAALFNFQKSRGTNGSQTTVANGDYIGAPQFMPYDGTSYLQTAGFGGKVNGTVTTGSVPTDMFFWTSGGANDTDPYGNSHVRMVINSSGNVGIGTTVPDKKLEINLGTTSALRLSYNDADGSAANFTDFSVGSTGSLTIAPTGTNPDISLTPGGTGSVLLANTSISDATPNLSDSSFGTCTMLATVGNVVTCSASDQTIKMNFNNFNNGLDFIRKIQPQTYSFKEGTVYFDNNRERLGLIAQEVQSAGLTDAVIPMGNGLLQVDYSAISAATISAVKELDLNLQGVTGTITPLAGSANEGFVTAFFNNVFGKITTWLADATNGIGDFFANRVRTKELCVSDGSGETCITKSQLDALISGAGGSSPLGGGAGGSGSNPATCSDGIQNQDETGIDTGGVCTPAVVEPPITEIPTCADGQILENNICVDPVVEPEIPPEIPPAPQE